VGAASDLVCLCVVGDDDKQVLDGGTGVLAGPAPGGIVEIHSTVHPDTCREIAKSAADKGISVIDAPVSGGAPAVSGGHPAGDGRRGGVRRREVQTRVRNICRPHRAPRPPCGGQVTKILNNLLFTANLGSAMSTLGRIVVFGGSLEGLAPHAGGLLQKDVRHATSLAAAASAPEGSVFTIADTALTLMHHPR
jgi:hypothetical protein